MRKFVPASELRATVRSDEPGPAMLMLAERSGRALNKAIVPVTEGANKIVSAVTSRSSSATALSATVRGPSPLVPS